jgi:hypothetical protein
MSKVLTTLAKPEPYLFSFVDGESVLVVRVIESSHAAAVERFRAMGKAERRRSAVTRLAGRDRDHVVSFAGWFERFLPRFGRSRKSEA